MPNKTLIIFGGANLPWIRPLLDALILGKINIICIEIIVTRNLVRWGRVKTLKTNELLWYVPPGFNSCLNYIFKKIIQKRLWNLFSINTHCLVSDPSLVKNIPKGFPLVYYMFDDNTLKEIEDRVACRQASIIVCTSRPLYIRTKKLHQDKKIIYSTHATDGITRSYLQEKENIISSIGLITDQYDWPLIASVVNRLACTKFFFVGEIQLWEQQNKLIWEKLLRRSNFHHEANADELYRNSVYNRSNIIWFPYDVQQDFNKYRAPLRLFNAVEAQCLIVSSDIPEVRKYEQFVSVCSSQEEVINTFQVLALEGQKYIDVENYNKFISENTWRHRATNLAQEIFTD